MALGISGLRQSYLLNVLCRQCLVVDNEEVEHWLNSSLTDYVVIPCVLGSTVTLLSSSTLIAILFPFYIWVKSSWWATLTISRELWLEIGSISFLAAQFSPFESAPCAHTSHCPSDKIKMWCLASFTVALRSFLVLVLLAHLNLDWSPQLPPSPLFRNIGWLHIFWCSYSSPLTFELIIWGWGELKDWHFKCLVCWERQKDVTLPLCNQEMLSWKTY